MPDLAVSSNTEIIAKVQKNSRDIDDFQSLHSWRTDSSYLQRKGFIVCSLGSIRYLAGEFNVVGVFSCPCVKVNLPII